MMVAWQWWMINNNVLLQLVRIEDNVWKNPIEWYLEVLWKVWHRWWRMLWEKWNMPAISLPYRLQLAGNNRCRSCKLIIQNRWGFVPLISSTLDTLIKPGRFGNVDPICSRNCVISINEKLLDVFNRMMESFFRDCNPKRTKSESLQLWWIFEIFVTFHWQ